MSHSAVTFLPCWVVQIIAKSNERYLYEHFAGPFYDLKSAQTIAKCAKLFRHHYAYIYEVRSPTSYLRGNLHQPLQPSAAAFFAFEVHANLMYGPFATMYDTCRWIALQPMSRWSDPDCRIIYTSGASPTKNE